MNELDIIRTPDVIAAEINGIKAQTRVVMLCGSIEIGRRLVEAKGMVEHGKWGEWLEKSVDYSQRTAQNLMKIFEEYGADQIPLFGDNAKTQALADLSYTQAVALLGIPAGEREQFVQEHDIDNMSTRELQQAIKERDEAQRKLDIMRNTLNETADERDELREKTSTLQSSVRVGDQVIKEHQQTIKILQDSLEKERSTRKTEVDRLARLLQEARAAGASDEKVKQLEADLTAAQAQVQELTKKINKPVTVETAVVEKVPEEIERELADLREKVKQPPAGAAIQRYAVHFDNLVAGFRSLLAALAEIKESDPSVHEKYKNAVIGLIGKMSEKL